jgi:hypothetical protein
MSKLMRALKLEWAWYDHVMDFLESRPDWYYNVKNYLRNFILFNKMAYQWRPWDSSHTIDVFVKLLIENAHDCKADKWHKNNNKRYRQALTAAHLLDRAYNYNVTKDKAYMYLARKYPYIMKDQTFWRGYDKGSLADKMHEFATKRIDKKEAQMKKEAWEYIHKHIENFWS